MKRQGFGGWESPEERREGQKKREEEMEDENGDGRRHVHVSVP